MDRAIYERSWRAFYAIPEDGRTEPDGWKVCRAPRMFTRAYVLIVRPDRSEYAPVWADKLDEALTAARAGSPIPDDCRAYAPPDEPSDGLVITFPPRGL